MDNIIGQVVLITEEILYQVWDMEEESGIWFMEISMKVNIWMIKKMEKVPIYGKMVQNMLVNFKMTIDMDMDKWIGMMENHIKENG